MKITEEGKKKLEENLENLNEELKKLREEKIIAYNLSGDTWHDNPYFNKLEQDERMLNAKISEAQSILKDAEIIKRLERNMKNVEIGSIVKCHCLYLDYNDEEEEIFEIVGHGETDIDAGKIHYESLVAKNLLGLGLNETVKFMTPGGEVEYKIIDFYPDWESTEKKGEN